MSAAIVELVDARLTLPSRAGLVEILRGVDIKLYESESVALVGPSGSGKTSALMVMAGLEQATSGQVRVMGRDFTALDEDGLARARGAGIGIVFQSFHLVTTMTAIENVALPLQFRGDGDAFERAAAMLEEVGLGHRLEHFPGQLSGGEQQRVALARALAPEPRLLLADEPTGNLDGATGSQVIELLFSLQKRRRATLVLVTHELSLADRCDRTLRMADGRVTPLSPVAA